MSWSEPPRRPGGARRALAVPGLLALLALLAACGFQPLYGRSPGGPVATVDDLALIHIRPLEHRTGQKLHNLLRDRLNPRGQPARPGYVLGVRLRESEDELGVQVDETATRANLRLDADYELYNAATNVRLTNGTTVSINSYNVLANEFATFSAKEDARDRGLRETAEEIKTRLSIFFHRARRGGAG